MLIRLHLFDQFLTQHVAGRIQTIHNYPAYGMNHTIPLFWADTVNWDQVNIFMETFRT
jgi:hypothetical protein